MLVFDGEYLVKLHFEVSEEEALDNGGIDLEGVKAQIKEMPSWLLEGITSVIDLRDNDTVTVFPCEGKLMRDDEILEESYDVSE